MVVGCGTSTSDRPAISELKQGMNLLDVKDPTAGMSAAFVKDSRVVYLQTRVGPLKPDVYRQADPAAPAYETDVRFSDQHGNTFFVSRGGDAYIDSSWEADIAAHMTANRKVVGTERDLDWSLAKEAAAAAVTALPASFKDHAYHFANFAARLTPAEDPAMQAKLARISKLVPSSAAGATAETGYGNFSYGNYSWFETDLYHHQLCFAWICPADHSFTYMWDAEWNGSSYSWALAIQSCNHGGCSTSPGGGYDGYASSGAWIAPGATITGDLTTSVGAPNGGCMTGYNWDTPPGHECNDDAAYELSQAKTGSLNTWWGGQYNFNRTDMGHTYACDCNINGCDGDWKHPSPPNN
jgi:hypothetical protein